MPFPAFVLTKSVLFRVLPLFLMTLLNPLTTAGQEPDEKQERSPFELRIELAKTNLHLAEVELQLAEIQNAKIESRLPPLVTGDRREKELRFRQISTSNIARLKSNVEIARANSPKRLILLRVVQKRFVSITRMKKSD